MTFNSGVSTSLVGNYTVPAGTYLEGTLYGTTNNSGNFLASRVNAGPGTVFSFTSVGSPGVSTVRIDGQTISGSTQGGIEVVLVGVLYDI